MTNFNTGLILALFTILSACAPVPMDVINLEETPTDVQLFAEGHISTQFYERDLAISPDGQELIYTLGDYKQTRRCLVILRKEEQSWSVPEILPFSGQYQDIEPFFSPNGQQLFFASNRPMGNDSARSDYNIWVCEKNNNEWGNARALDTMINQQGDEFYPAVGATGNLYFTATREDGVGREDIFVSLFQNDKYQQPTVLDTNVNSAVYEFNAYVNPAEDLLVFSSYGRADDLGGSDLYYCTKNANGQWNTAIHFDAPINSDKLDYCPFIDYTNGNFYFTSERSDLFDGQLNTVDAFIEQANKAGNGLGNIYRIGLNQLGIDQ